MKNIVALHGFTGRGSDWDILADALSEYRFAAPDLPGHGPDPELPAGLGAHLEAVDAALERIDGMPVLLGYSMGGRVALHVALAMPDRFSALVLIGASPGLADPAEREARRLADAALAARIRRSDTASFLREWDGTPLLAGRVRMREPWKSRSLAARLENTPEGLAASLEGVGTGALAPLWGRLAGLRIPALFIAGARDTKFSGIAREMAAIPPGALAAEIPDAGHAAHFEAPAAVAAAMRDFMSEP